MQSEKNDIHCRKYNVHKKSKKENHCFFRPKVRFVQASKLVKNVYIPLDNSREGDNNEARNAAARIHKMTTGPAFGSGAGTIRI